jgi:hypothetical protein
LRGNDPAAPVGRITRGQRAFCSDRGLRGGCGKTFPLFLAGVLPRHTFNSTLLWALLRKLLDGSPSIKTAAETLRLPFSMEAIYGILRRCKHRLDAVRSLLSRDCRAPVSGRTDPFLQTLEHLRESFAVHPCAIAGYQRHWQRGFLG